MKVQWQVTKERRAALSEAVSVARVCTECAGGATSGIFALYLGFVPPVRAKTPLSNHHAHCIKEIFHFWWAIVQLKYDSPGLMRVQKSHTYSIFVFRVSGDLNSLLLQFRNR